eukprot:TRINITY_DN29964_c0_g1_i4.p1 TRINITY_DN29964_c0_g1~~TRINITY_DN29964_c0_g1_i4.p1  ORF type:complete len:865 (+),score=166.23 TRINITY_DN29964_c0_g1_i4:136-2730(+)
MWYAQPSPGRPTIQTGPVGYHLQQQGVAGQPIGTGFVHAVQPVQSAPVHHTGAAYGGAAYGGFAQPAAPYGMSPQQPFHFHAQPSPPAQVAPGPQAPPPPPPAAPVQYENPTVHIPDSTHSQAVPSGGQMGPQGSGLIGFLNRATGALGAAMGSMQLGPDGRDIPAGPIEEAQQRLARAMISGDANELQVAIAEAQRIGVPGHEVRRARDALLAMEHDDFRTRADLVVEEAIQSDDSWKLQAAMQMVVGFGLAEHQARLKEAMQSQKKRQDAINDLKKYSRAGDPARLRTAIEAALMAYVQEPHIKNAREALKAMEGRNTALSELRAATASGSNERVRAALDGADRCAVPLEDENVKAAKTQLREYGTTKGQQMLDAQDVVSLRGFLNDAALKYHLSDADIADLTRKCASLESLLKHRRALQQAVAGGLRSDLVAAIEAATAAGLGESETRAASEKLAVVEAMDHKARQEAREQSARVAAQKQAFEELLRSLEAQDPNRLAAAIAGAERNGLAHAQETTSARHRLQWLRASSGASQELYDAAQIGDVYRLRAALATAKNAGVREEEIRRAHDTLRRLEGQTQARKALEAASKSGDPQQLERAIAAARGAGVGGREISDAMSHLRHLGNSNVATELQAATAAADAAQLHAALRAATEACYNGPEVSAAAGRLRQLESTDWMRRQLQAAATSGDCARLQAAIQQAEQAGFASQELDAARRQLGVFNAQLHARQELRLARAGGNPYALMAAIRAAEAAGLPPAEIADARAESQGIPLGDFSPPSTALTGPALSGPPTDPQSLVASPSSYATPGTNYSTPGTNYSVPGTNYGAPGTEPQLMQCSTNYSVPQTINPPPAPSGPRVHWAD